LKAFDKKKLSEIDICDLFISPAIKDAGWDPMTQIRREVTLAPGPVVVRGNVASRNKKKKKFADYVLYKEHNVPIAVVEAKDNNHTISQGLQQALDYAEILNIPSAYSSNGDAFASHNKVPAPGEDIETQFPLNEFPAPGPLWQRYKSHRGIKDAEEPVVLQLYHEDASGKEPRYYQADAINSTMEAVARGDKRVLWERLPKDSDGKRWWAKRLVMATGTGKTYTTFQTIWRLWKGGTINRALFLADRDILIDQALTNDFKPFGGAMTKVTGHKFDPAYEIFLGLYQAITGKEEEEKSFKKLSRDFFRSDRH
jgi:type I restriction enzyme, R subunit